MAAAAGRRTLLCGKIHGYNGQTPSPVRRARYFVKRLLLLVWLGGGLLTGARAVTLLSDAFSYPDGSLVAAPGSPWWTTSGTTGEVKVVAGQVLLAQTNSEDVGALLAGQPYGGSAPETLYAGFLFRLTALPGGGGEYFAHFASGVGSGTHRARVFVTTSGAAPGAFRLGLANASGAPNQLLPRDLALDTDYFLVLRYTPSNAASGLWLNPGAETDPSLAAADSASVIPISSFRWRQSLGMGALLVDNLVVGTRFDDALEAAPQTPPTITDHPRSLERTEGSNAVFSVAAASFSPLTCQWWSATAGSDAQRLSGETNATLSLTAVAAADAGEYWVVVANAFGSVTSQVATLTVTAPIPPPQILASPPDQTVALGGAVVLAVEASGLAPLTYQWQFFGTNLPGATDREFAITNAALEQAGPYQALVFNPGGVATSAVATVTVLLPPPPRWPNVTVMTYNVKGNGAADWSTNAAQVRAIGRQLRYLDPDIITFNEIPHSQVWEMTNFVSAFLPGYYLATNSVGDGFIRSVIASRYPIVLSQSYLHGSSLAPFGYGGVSKFTRDLFLARVAAPGYAQPLDVYTTHLKATTTSPQDDADKRAAEARAITSFLQAAYARNGGDSNGPRPYLLTGDLNEDVFRPDTRRYTSGEPIQTLTNGVDLRLMTPVQPATLQDFTISIQASLNARFDYILPCGLLFSNVVASQVFRTDRLDSPPPPLLATDSRTASDHLPVLTVFANPYVFSLTGITRSDGGVTITWNSVTGQPYRVEASSNLASWQLLAAGLVATNGQMSFRANPDAHLRFFRVGTP